jgi:hypothetical protein
MNQRVTNQSDNENSSVAFLASSAGINETPKAWKGNSVIIERIRAVSVVGYVAVGVVLLVFIILLVIRRKKDPYKELHLFVQRAEEQGFTREFVTRELQNIGWDQKSIEEAYTNLKK